MTTRREVITAALEELRITGAAETPSAEDYDVAKRRYQAELSLLRDDGLAYWEDTGDDVDEIPNRLERGLALLLAGRLARPFGKEEPTEMEEDGRLVTISILGLRILRRHIAKKPTGEPTEFRNY